MFRRFTSTNTASRKVLYVYKKNDIATPIAATVFSGALYSYIIISEQQKEYIYLKRQNEEIVERLKRLKI